MSETNFAYFIENETKLVNIIHLNYSNIWVFPLAVFNSFIDIQTLFQDWKQNPITTMDIFKEFLETSTIGGLYHIYTTKYLYRYLWISIVFTSFTISFIEIYALFQDWAQNPITTTSEIRVCFQKELRYILPDLNQTPMSVN